MRWFAKMKQMIIRIKMLTRMMKRMITRMKVSIRKMKQMITCIKCVHKTDKADNYIHEDVYKKHDGDVHAYKKCL